MSLIRRAGGPPDVDDGARPAGRPTLLLDHGGVISTSTPDPAGMAAFAANVAARLPLAVERVPADDVRSAIAQALERYANHKRVWLSRFQADEVDAIPEIRARDLWADVGATLGGRFDAWLSARAHELTEELARARDVRALRPGIPELLADCRSRGVPVVVVSNTISGRMVRAECARHGIAADVAATVCSDEFGARKPSPGIFREALAAVGAEPARTWFLGDKPVNDAAGAHAVGIAHRVLIRGGSTDDDALDRSLVEGVATRVIASPTELVGAID